MELDEQATARVRELLAPIRRDVTLVLFTQRAATAMCREQESLLRLVAGLSDRVKLEVRDLVADAAEARRHGVVNRLPATVILGEKDHGIRFYGVTGGYELTSLLEAVVMVGTGRSGLPEELERLVLRIERRVHLEVIVTLTCPYCPRMVHLAHQMAFLVDGVEADMIEATEFPELVQRYHVHGVPRTVIDGGPAFEGALPAPQAILRVLAVGNPQAYEQIESELREARGERRARAMTTDRLYDVLVIGAGPAAFAAAVYAARKNVDVGLLGDVPGGQVADTATVENWLGDPSIGGPELVAAFRRHAEQYAISERLHVVVESIRRDDGGFEVSTKDGARYRARSVVYAAGKRFRRLGVPGEARFLGRGIAFCATCDAPLFRDKKVAVIGGGNSAFTAARDLVGYASEIHVVNVRPGFEADPVLEEQVRAARHVQLHAPFRVREFLGGDDRLTAVRLESVDGTSRMDLAVDGAFLEIGLEPNSEPIRGLVERNPRGEIPVDRDQATTVPGMFAAGDVTDEREKQIVTAASAGAKAALSAVRWLLR